MEIYTSREEIPSCRRVPGQDERRSSTGTAALQHSSTAAPAPKGGRQEEEERGKRLEARG